jgi:nucleoside-diphosphate kinase
MSENNETYEQTFAMLKPDALQRGEAGEIISRMEEAGLTISAIDITTPDEELAKEHYEEHSDKPFYDDLVEYVTEFPVMPMVIEGRNAVEKVRGLMGESFEPTECSPGTIRGDLSSYSAEDADQEGIPTPNLIHGAEAYEDAEREIELWFGEEELEHYKRPDVEHIRETLGYQPDGGSIDFDRLNETELKEEYLAQELEGEADQALYDELRATV